jgi:hypothetical protein
LRVVGRVSRPGALAASGRPTEYAASGCFLEGWQFLAALELDAFALAWADFLADGHPSGARGELAVSEDEARYRYPLVLHSPKNLAVLMQHHSPVISGPCRMSSSCWACRDRPGEGRRALGSNPVRCGGRPCCRISAGPLADGGSSQSPEPSGIGQTPDR